MLSQMFEVEISNSCNTGLGGLNYIYWIACRYIYIPSRVN